MDDACRYSKAAYSDARSTENREGLVIAGYFGDPSEALCVLGGDANFGEDLAPCGAVVGSGFGAVENVRSKQSRMAWSDVMSMQFGPACTEFDEKAMQAAVEINRVRTDEILCVLQRPHSSTCGSGTSNPSAFDKCRRTASTL